MKRVRVQNARTWALVAAQTPQRRQHSAQFLEIDEIRANDPSPLSFTEEGQVGVAPAGTLLVNAKECTIARPFPHSPI